jgi:hypothetical protein
VRGVLRHFLVKVLGESGTDRLYDRRDDVTRLILPVITADTHPEDVAGRIREYCQDLETLRMLVWGWLGAVSPATANGYDGGEVVVTPETLVEAG